MEIPTYPYEGEFGKGVKEKVSLKIDHIFRKKLVKCIDRIVVTGANVGDSLWGVKAINIVNGIDFSTVNQRDFLGHGDVINISCIAKFSPWHGYERLIIGLADYYAKKPKQEVNLLMVGDGSERSVYEKLVTDNRLDNHVKFLGRLTGEKLNEIYDITDIGACSFGRYKSGINVIGDLKSREFLAKGIPMICGCEIDVLRDKEYKYALFFPNDSSAININEVVEWHNQLAGKSEQAGITETIRSISKEWIDYGVTFKPVIIELEGLWEK
jgi:glycosyltransferase involved in cell wall biosynthesis